MKEHLNHEEKNASLSLEVPVTLNWLKINQWGPSQNLAAACI